MSVYTHATVSCNTLVASGPNAHLDLHCNIQENDFAGAHIGGKISVTKTGTMHYVCKSDGNCGCYNKADPTAFVKPILIGTGGCENHDSIHHEAFPLLATSA